ncbi:hypothetical protein IKF40_02315 [Candidatus Saccharibacteria bacterium]|nr:hypothetical protein [Candidatus Saccharibacteria bacterium]
MKRAKSIIWGLALLALGVIFGGKALGIFNFDIFFEGWWTLFIIIPSVVSFITEKEKFSSLTFLACGIILLLAAQNVFSYDVAWKVMLAAALVFFGLSLVFKNIFHSKHDKEVAEHVKNLKEKGGSDSQVAIFSSNESVYNKEEFTSDDIVAIFGGASLDLRNAILKKDAAIKVFCLFGGVEIIVPEDVTIKTKSGFIFGGISDDRKNNTEKSTHTLFIEAAGGFGGVTIKDTKSKK